MFILIAAVALGGKAVAGGGIAVAAGGLGLAVQGQAVPRDAFGTSQQAEAVAAVEGKFAHLEAVFVVDAVAVIVGNGIAGGVADETTTIRFVN